MIVVKTEENHHLISTKMKTGDVIAETTLKQQGFYFNCFFAGLKVYKRFNPADEDFTYVFYDFFNQTIDVILTTKE